MTTITLPASKFRDLVTPVLPFTDQSTWSLPVLEAVLLRGHGEYLTATATDRYVAVVKRLRCEAPTELYALVSRSTLRQILSVFKGSRSFDPELTLTFEDDRLTVATSGGMDLLDASMSFPLAKGEFPLSSLLPLLREAADGEPLPFDRVAIAPSLIAKFGGFASKDAPMVLRQAARRKDGQHRPVFVAIGDDVRGMVMPVRVAGETTTDLDSDSWAAIVADPPKPTPKAPTKRRRTAVAV